MAKIGLKFPIAAVISGYDSHTGAPIYVDPFVIGKAITAEKNIENNDNPLYGDDAIAENDTSFASGTIKLGVTGFGNDKNDGLQVQGKMLGQSVVTLPGGGYRIRRSALISAPYLGFGFYKTKKQNDVLFYESTWIYKTMWKTPSESTTTKGKSIEWQAPEIEGNIMAVDGFDNDTFEDTAVFDTEQAAKSWLCEMSGLRPNGDRSSLNALISTINALDPEDYTSASWADLYTTLEMINTTLHRAYITADELSAMKSQLNTLQSALVTRS